MSTRQELEDDLISSETEPEAMRYVLEWEGHAKSDPIHKQDRTVVTKRGALKRSKSPEGRRTVLRTDEAAERGAAAVQQPKSRIPQVSPKRANGPQQAKQEKKRDDQPVRTETPRGSESSISLTSSTVASKAKQKQKVASPSRTAKFKASAPTQAGTSLSRAMNQALGGSRVKVSFTEKGSKKPAGLADESSLSASVGLNTSFLAVERALGNMSQASQPAEQIHNSSAIVGSDVSGGPTIQELAPEEKAKVKKIIERLARAENQLDKANRDFTMNKGKLTSENDTLQQQRDELLAENQELRTRLTSALKQISQLESSQEGLRQKIEEIKYEKQDASVNAIASVAETMCQTDRKIYIDAGVVVPGEFSPRHVRVASAADSAEVPQQTDVSYVSVGSEAAGDLNASTGVGMEPRQVPASMAQTQAAVSGMRTAIHSHYDHQMHTQTSNAAKPPSSPPQVATETKDVATSPIRHAPIYKEPHPSQFAREPASPTMYGPRELEEMGYIPAMQVAPGTSGGPVERPAARQVSFNNPATQHLPPTHDHFHPTPSAPSPPHTVRNDTTHSVLEPSQGDLTYRIYRDLQGQRNPQQQRHPEQPKNEVSHQRPVANHQTIYRPSTVRQLSMMGKMPSSPPHVGSITMTATNISSSSARPMDLVDLVELIEAEEFREPVHSLLSPKRRDLRILQR
eukprot:Clim_evm133s149 gene=Clim_evmTU133s149